MDAKVVAIELPRVERERRESTALASAGGAVVDAGGAVPRPDLASERVGFSDTFVHQHPVHELDPAQRERERILWPGATGAIGGPYKMLRTQVLARLRQLKANSLAVMSAFSGEGKTLTAINLAVAIAADHVHTALLVDLDLRNPSIHRRFGFVPDCGIEDCLQQQRPIHEAMVKIKGYDRLTILSARSAIEQSSELLGTHRMAELMRELRGRYLNRILIFDVPPVLMADDALVFSRFVQAGLLVVSEGKTARDGVTRSITTLDKLPIVGTVLNGAQARPVRYY